MEWPNIYESSSNPPLLSSFSSPQFEGDHQPLTEWTFEENKLFENALAEFGLDSLSFFEHVASKLPYKSMEQIKKHYENLLEDVEMIEAGLFPMPNYVTPAENSQGDMESKSQKAPSTQPRKTCSGHQRKRGVPWTEEEHQLFLMGLNKYGKGDWRSISRYYVVTKTPTQVASHAQKFFRRQTNTTPSERRRPSIHDIQTVNSTFFSLPNQKHKNPILPNELKTLDVVPLPNPYGLLPMYNHNFNNNELTNFAMEIPVLPPGTSMFPVVNSMINQPPSAYPSSSSYPFPYPGNYP